MDLANKLIQFEQKLRLTEDRVALRYDVVNELATLIDFTQCFMATGFDQAHFKVMAATNITKVDRTAPLIQILDTLIRQKLVIKRDSVATSGAVSDWGDDVAEQLALPPFFAMLPLYQPGENGRTEGVVLIFRFRAFSPSELELLTRIAQIITQGIASLRGRRYSYSVPTKRKIKNVGWGVLFAVFVASLIPVDLSVVAPLKIVPLRPLVVAAPFNGVIKDVYVIPDQVVKRGELLAQYDTRELAQELSVSQATLNQTQARFSQVTKQGFLDPSARQELAVLQTDIEIAQEKVKLAQLRLNSATIVAAKDATIVIDSPDKWQGRPVQTGEQILSLVSSSEYLVEIYVAANNMIPVHQDKPLSLYLDSQPLSSLSANILYMDFEPSIDESGILNYRIVAQIDPFTNDIALRIGLKGTARIYGDKYPFIYQLFRRPLVAWRQTFG